MTTWNLQGRERPDLGVVASVLAGLSPDVVLAQEVQRRQARRLAEMLGWAGEWRFKHWPVVVAAEGLAVLAPSVSKGRSVVLAARWRFWSSDRRIAVVASIPGPAGDIEVASVHLGAGVSDDERARQAALVAGVGAEVVGGDLNTAPGSVVLETFRDRGYDDAWAIVRPGDAGPTNWKAGPRDGPPTQRLDYVLRSPGWHVAAAEVPAPGDPGFERYGALSDHLPLTVTLERS